MQAIRIIIGGLIGLVLADHGMTILTPGFWIVFGLTAALIITLAYD